MRSWLSVLSRSASLLLTLMISVAVALGQASLSGVVRDASGAAVPQASVSVSNRTTGQLDRARSNAVGVYWLPSLSPGAEQVTVEAAGFGTIVQDGVQLQLGQNARLDFDLTVSSSRQTINVYADTPKLDTTDASVSTLGDSRSIGHLPLNGRSFQTLFELTPGVVTASTSYYDQGQFHINGQRASANYIMVDGVSAGFGIFAGPAGQSAGGSAPALSVFGGFSSLASVDALDEFRIQSSTYAPEFGRTAGAQVSVSTRSGSESFHGAIFDYLRNGALDASNWFVNQQGLSKPLENQNDFGGLLGGPLMGKHTFFFFSYEGVRLRQPLTAVGAVPGVALRQSVSGPAQILLNAFPLPNGPSLANGLAQFSTGVSDPGRMDALSLRIDHTTGGIHLFGRFNDAPSSATGQPGGIAPPNNIQHIVFNTLTATAGLNWTIGPVLNNELRLNFSRSEAQNSSSLLAVDGAAQPASASLFGQGGPDTGSFLFVCCGLGASFSVGAIARNSQNQVNIVDSISYLRGSHEFKAGVDYRQLNPLFGRSAFDTQFIFNSAADLVNNLAPLVYLDNASGAAGLRARTRNLSLYAQDTWRILPQLTLTYGLRTEIDPPLSVLNRQAPWSADQTDNVATMRLAPPGSPLWSTTYRNIAPRFGAAYQLVHGGNTAVVLRGGAGIFYDLGMGQMGDVFALDSQYYATTALTGGTAFPLSPSLAAAPLQTGGTSPVLQTALFDPHLRLPYTMQWNTGIEAQLSSSQTLSISWVGAAGRRLLLQRLYSNPNPQFISAYVTTNGAASDYDALQVQFRRVLTKGVQLLGSYTWSHSIDNASSDSFLLTAAPGRASSDFDIRHSASGSLSLDIPESHWRLLPRAIFRNWSADILSFARTAPPITVVAGAGFSGGIYTSSFPNVVPSVPLLVGNPDVAGGRQINPAAFTPAPAGQNGNAPRNLLRGFGAIGTDISVQRQIPLTEHIRLRFRCEAFNLFNHPDFAPPLNSLSSPLFGISTATLNNGLGSGGTLGGFSPLYQIGGPRSFQFSLRLQF